MVQLLTGVIIVIKNYNGISGCCRYIVDFRIRMFIYIRQAWVPDLLADRLYRKFIPLMIKKGKARTAGSSKAEIKAST